MCSWVNTYLTRSCDHRTPSYLPFPYPLYLRQRKRSWLRCSVKLCPSIAAQAWGKVPPGREKKIGTVGRPAIQFDRFLRQSRHVIRPRNYHTSISVIKNCPEKLMWAHARDSIGCRAAEETPLQPSAPSSLHGEREKKQVCEAPLEYLIKGFAATSALSCLTSNYTSLNLVLTVFVCVGVGVGVDVVHSRLQQQFICKHTSWSVLNQMLQIWCRKL